MADEQLKIKIGADVGQAVSGINQVTTSLKKLTPGGAQATQSLLNLSRVAQDAPFGLIGIANNIEPLITSFVSLKKETGSAVGAFKALGSSLMGAGGLILVVGLVTAAMSLYGMATRGASKDTDDLTNTKKSLAKVSEEVAKSTGGELANLQSLINIASDVNIADSARLEAMKELNRLYPEKIGNMKIDANTTKVLADLYPQLSKAIIDQAKARAIASEIDASVARQRKLETQDLEDNLSVIQKGLAILKGGTGFGGGGVSSAVTTALKDRATAIQKEIDLQSRLGSEIFKTNLELAKSGDLFKDKDVKDRTLKAKTLKIIPDKVVVGTENIKLDEIEVAKNQFSPADAVGRIRNPLGDLPAQYTEAAEAARLLQERNEKIAGVITDQLTPAFSSFFEDLLSGSKTTFSDFGKMILGVIKKLVAAAAAAAVLALIIGAATGGASFGAGASTLMGGFKGLFSGMTGIGLSANPGSGSGALMGAARGGSSGTLQAVVRGQDLLFVMRRATDDKNRLG